MQFKYLIRLHPIKGFGVVKIPVLANASSETDSNLIESDLSFNSIAEVMTHASKENPYLSIVIHPECENSESKSVLRRLNKMGERK